MGTSTNAILFYGYAWEDEDTLPWECEENDNEDPEDEDQDDWESRYAKAMGLGKPTEQYPERFAPDGYSTPKDYTSEETAIIELYSKYWNNKNALVETSPCTIGIHCSYEYPMHYVAIQKSHTVSHRGSATIIKNLKVKPEWNKQLKEFCKVIGIDISEMKPAWYLVSLWG